MMKLKISVITLMLASTFLQTEGFTATTPTTSTSKTASTSDQTITPALHDFDYTTQNKIPWLASGYNTWKWNDHSINYVEMGDKSKPAILLIHGFGASAYHYRYNIPDLARDYHVYAFDMLGFGLSSKPITDYSAEVWRDQTVDFIEEVIGKTTTVVGNSLGGFTALYAASSSAQSEKSLINGCVLLNAAGRFKNPDAPPEKEPNAIIDAIATLIKRAVIQLSFIYTKQPARIEQVLRQVYPINANNVDEELVESIRYPSLDPNAAEVFYRVITKNGSGPQVYVDDLLQDLNGIPLMLCWGENDPWIRPAAADKIQALYPSSLRVSIDAGHCPHDEAPEDVNLAVRNFMSQLGN